MERKLISLENTRFIYNTNFSGDPEMDRFHSMQRKGNIIIPDEGLARELLSEGFNIKQTKPRDGEEEGFEPTYYVSVIVNFKSKFPPKIYFVSGNSAPVHLDEESIRIIDRTRISNVNTILSPHEYEDGKFTLYVRTMYVEQDLEDDPFAARYAARMDEQQTPIDDNLPF